MKCYSALLVANGSPSLVLGDDRTAVVLILLFQMESLRVFLQVRRVSSTKSVQQLRAERDAIAAAAVAEHSRAVALLSVLAANTDAAHTQAATEQEAIVAQVAALREEAATLGSLIAAVREDTEATALALLQDAAAVKIQRQVCVVGGLPCV